MSTNQPITKTDKIQINAFQMFFRLRKDEIGNDAAFASALFDTADDKFIESYKKNAPLIRKYMKEFTRKTRINKAPYRNYGT